MSFLTTVHATKACRSSGNGITTKIVTAGKQGGDSSFRLGILKNDSDYNIEINLTSPFKQTTYYFAFDLDLNGIVCYFLNDVLYQLLLNAISYLKAIRVALTA